MALNPYKVVPSGTVGKQVIPITGKTVELVAYSLVASAGIASVAFRDGKLGASGTVIWEDKAEQGAISGVAAKFKFPEGLTFNKGMHVTVIGTGAVAYLLVK